MKKINNKKLIIFGSFIFVCALSVYFASSINMTKGAKKVIVNVNETTNESEEIKLADTKSSCATKDYTKCGCDSITDSSGKEQCKLGCTYCASCYSDSQLKSDGYCYKKPTKVSSVKVDGRNYYYLAADESATFNFSATSNPSGASDFSPSWSISPSGASGSGSGSRYTVTASGNGKGTGSNCKETAYTVKASQNGGSATATVKVCKYCSEWKGPIAANLLYKNKQNTSKPEKGCYYFEGEREVEGGYAYTAYYTRCCSTPKSDFGGCYGNKKYLGISSDAGWQEKATTARPYKFAGVSEENCHPININICSASPTSPEATTVYTGTCEDEVSFSYKDGTTCSNYDSSTENNFYTIECERSIKTQFDYGDDDSVSTGRILYKGQGFKFGVKVTSVHTCTAKFNKDTWLKTYNLFLEKIKYVSSSLIDSVKRYDVNGYKKAVSNLKAGKDVESEVFELWNIMEDLRKVVINDYIGYTPDNKYNEQIDITIPYTIKGKKANMSDQFVIDNDNSTDGEYTKTNSSTKYNLTDSLKNVPEYFVISNENNPRVVKLIPKRAYIDKSLGKDITSDLTNVDGGNKVYVDYNIDSTPNGKSYTINVNVSGLGSNGSKVINNLCGVQIADEEVLYRPIELSNPFINSSWDIGDNWSNDVYNFTNVIKSDVWNKRSRYTINMTNQDIDDTKASNERFKDDYPYLGLCDRISPSSQDAITRKICEILNKTVD